MRTLHYPADVTASVTPGRLMGPSYLLEWWEVIDAVYVPKSNTTHVAFRIASPR